MCLLRKVNTNPADKITIYINNQSLLDALRFPKTKSGQWLVEGIVSREREIPDRIKVVWMVGSLGEDCGKWRQQCKVGTTPQSAEEASNQCLCRRTSLQRRTEVYIANQVGQLAQSSKI